MILMNLQILLVALILRRTSGFLHFLPNYVAYRGANLYKVREELRAHQKDPILIFDRPLDSSRTEELDIASIQETLSSPTYDWNVFNSWYQIWIEILLSERDIVYDHTTRYIIPLSNRVSLESGAFVSLVPNEDGTFILELSTKPKYDDSEMSSSTNTILLTETHLSSKEMEDMVHEGFLIPLFRSCDIKRFVLHLPKFIRHLTEVSFFYNANLCTTEDSKLMDNTFLHENGIVALNLLGLLSSRSMKYVDHHTAPFLVDEVSLSSSQESMFNDDTSNSHNHGNIETEVKAARGRNVIYPVHHLLDSSTIEAVQKHLVEMKQGGLLSTNLDSVDSLPSLHLNLISNGHVLFEDEWDTEAMDEKDLLFQQNTVSMFSLLQPFLYHKLLPLARKALKSPTLQISDVFIRNYGINVQRPSVTNTNDVESREPSLQDGNSRLKLSAHYDVLSAGTCVIALDNVAVEGKRGLYTMSHHSLLTNQSPSHDVDPASDGQVLSHFALRRFFPLHEGDGVIHSWDILHGVHIDESVQRSSLIVWFTDGETNALPIKNQPEFSNSHYGSDLWPWLRPIDKTDDVGKVVLALAKESTPTESMKLPLSSNSIENNPFPNETRRHISDHPYVLFKESASLGNSFALARLGSLCEEEKLSADQCTRSELYSILQRLRSSTTRTTVGCFNPFLPNTDSEEMDNLSWFDLAKACWFESAMRGYKLAQIQLADACMHDYFSIRDLSSSSNTSRSNSQYSCLRSRECLLRMASTLFFLAFQQDGEDVKSSLTRLAKLEFSRFMDDYNLDDESFDQALLFSRPVMKILQSSL